MNILILSKDGELLGIADRLVREGHVVKTFSTAKRTGYGVYETIENQDVFSAIKWCRFIVSDDFYSKEFYDKIAMYNRPIVGSSYFARMINEDCVREYAVCDKMGVKTPETRVPSSVSEIYDIVMDWELPRYDIRFDRSFFPGKNTEFMTWSISNLPPNKTILMQEPIEGDVDVRLVGLFNGHDFLRPFFITTEGTEEEGHCVVVPMDEKSSLADQNLIKLTTWLRTVDYHGPVECKLTLKDEDVWLREIYLGFSFPMLYAILEGLEVPVGELLNCIALGIPQECLKFNGKVAAALETTSKDWKNLRGAPILELEDPEKLKHVFPVGVMKSDIEKEEYFVSGECETIYTATAFAKDVTEARKRIMRTVGGAQFPGISCNPHLHMTANYPLTILGKRNYINA
jgi:hypothetical protein